MKLTQLAVLLLGGALLTGCATKRDLRRLTLAVDSVRLAHDAQVRELQRQNQLLLDSLRVQNARLRGDLLAQLLQMDRQLVQIQELTGQGQQRINELREQLSAREQAMRSAPAGAPGAGAEGDPQEIYDAALASLQRGSFTTARAGFEDVVRNFPQHPRAADAQFQIGEAYAGAKDVPNALTAYARVGELYPSAPRAATALLRMATLELERGNRDRARTLFSQLVTAYPRSPEAPQARTQLQRLRG